MVIEAPVGKENTKEKKYPRKADRPPITAAAKKLVPKFSKRSRAAIAGRIEKEKTGNAPIDRVPTLITTPSETKRKTRNTTTGYRMVVAIIGSKEINKIVIHIFVVRVTVVLVTVAIVANDISLLII